MGPHIEKNTSCWKAYSRIVDAISLIEALPELSPEELQSGMRRVCETPEYSERAMTLDEVAFWAGVSTGLSLARSVEEGLVDPGIRERMAVYSALFAQSTKAAVVEMTLQDLEE